MLACSVDDEEMAILYSCVEMNYMSVFLDNLFVVGLVLVQIFDEHITFFCFQSSARMVFDMVAIDADDVAAYGHVIWCKCNADAGCFKRAAAFVHLVLVIA